MKSCQTDSMAALVLHLMQTYRAEYLAGSGGLLPSQLHPRCARTPLSCYQSPHSLTLATHRLDRLGYSELEQCCSCVYYWQSRSVIAYDDCDEACVSVMRVRNATSRGRSLAAIVSTLPLQAFFGTAGMAAFLGSSLASVLILTTVNYVEHYGLTRKRLPSGKYENVSIHHSWYVLYDHSRTYRCPCNLSESVNSRSSQRRSGCQDCACWSE